MGSRITKFPRARAVALAVGVGVIGSLATAPASFAAAPGGTACQPGASKYDAAGGKISGRGSTFQNNAINKAFIAGYTSDVCGSVPAQYTGDPGTTNMISYNSEAGTFTGSGNGEAAMACRTDAFGGTDIPYDQTGLGQLWGPAGTFTRDGITGCDPGSASGLPYSPQPNGAAPFYPSTQGGATNTQATMMSFPVAIGSAAIGVHFTSAGCPTAGSQIQLTPSQVSGLFGGTISNWSTLGSEPSFNWTTCSVPVTRVVRADVSGTTQAVKTYFRDADPNLTLCTPPAGGGTANWASYAVQLENTNWPGDSAEPCTGVTAPTTASGTGALVTAVVGGNGTIGYGDLPAWFGKGALLAQLTPSTGGATVNPFQGSSFTATSAPNCDVSTLPSNLPGSGAPADSVGLNSTDGVTPSTSNWGTDAATGGGGTIPSDITNKGSLYPICTLTYDMTYAGESAAFPGGPIGGLTDNQRRTLYTFFRYALSPDAQNRLKVQGYLPLPSNWASLERTGVSNAF
jgi:ABC-type phosphate transport system substrate-binding protein